MQSVYANKQPAESMKLLMGCAQKEPTWVVVQVGWGAADVVVLVVVGFVEVDDAFETVLEVVGALIGVEAVEVVVEVVDVDVDDKEIIEELLLTCVPEASLYQFACGSFKHTPTGTAMKPISKKKTPHQVNPDPNLPFHP